MLALLFQIGVGFCKIYLSCIIVIALVSTAFIIAIRMTSRKSKLLYKLKVAFLLFYSFTTMGLMVPIFLLRPRSIKNFQINGWIIGRLNWALELTWEVRNTDRVTRTEGAIICCNHQLQSWLDIYGLLNSTKFIKNTTAVGKREILYAIPVGLALWLCGLIMIKRESPAQSYRLLDETAQRIKDENIKLVVYPEGTRNRTSELMQPFKKGAFRTAINAQAPIIPLVISPYYFLQDEIFDKGHIIYSVLEPIPTAGLTETDLDNLIERTRNVMLEEFIRLTGELNEKRKQSEWRDAKRPTITLHYGQKSN